VIEVHLEEQGGDRDQDQRNLPPVRDRGETTARAVTVYTFGEDDGTARVAARQCEPERGVVRRREVGVLERGDVREVVDLAAADLIVLYRLGDLPDGISAQVEVLARMAELTAEAMPRLRSMRNLSEYWIEINRLENQADQAYRRLLADLFNNGADAITVLKLKEVIDELEAAADAFETVAHTVESIAVKES